MKDVTSILVVLDRSARDTPLVNKALVLARELNARIELFSCDAEHEYALKHAYDRRGVEAARQKCVADLYDYLRRLSYVVTAQDVAVSVDVVCESPQYEGIVHKVFKTCPDLVMKAAASGDAAGSSALDSNDWELVRTCPVPLLLSRGRAWSTRPRFAAAVDVSDEESPSLLQRILRLRRARGCGRTHRENARRQIAHSSEGIATRTRSCLEAHGRPGDYIFRVCRRAETRRIGGWSTYAPGPRYGARRNAHPQIS
jgi:universal stress protein E